MVGGQLSSDLGVVSCCDEKEDKVGCEAVHLTTLITAFALILSYVIKATSLVVFPRIYGPQSMMSFTF
jgi:hypothetical protein